MIEAKLSKWVVASINKYFNDGKGSYVLIFQNQDEPKSVPTWATLRIDGPDVDEITKGYFHVDVSINIICTVAQNNNLYSIQDLVGYFQNLMSGTISIYNQDSDTVLGCLRRETKVNTFPLATKVRAAETAVEASFTMEYTNVQD